MRTMSLRDALRDARNAGYNYVINSTAGLHDDIAAAIEDAAGYPGEYIRINNIIFDASDIWKDDAETWELEY